jgi:hypothetical protein
MTGETAAGITGGTVDVAVEPAAAAIFVEATVDENFGLFARGEIEQDSGRAEGVGGGTLNPGIGVDQWVRFSTIQLNATTEGVAVFRLTVGGLTFAEFGIGLIGYEDVSTFDANIIVVSGLPELESTRRSFGTDDEE